MSIYTTNHRIAGSLDGRGLKIAAVIIMLLIAFSAMTALTGCEFSNLKDQEYGPVDSGNPTDTTGTDTTGSGTDTTTGQIAISVAPNSISIRTGETAQFTATVTGTTNTGVTWIVVSGPGTISGAGLYQAPATISTPAEIVTVKAISNAKASVSATGTVVVTPQPTGSGGGDTAGPGEICFQRDVLPIFQSNCAKSGCHDVNTRRKGYAFVDYNGVMRGIDPGRPDNSEIYEKITETRLDKRMPPPPNAALTSAQIATIRQWIQEGGRNTICPPPTGSCDTNNVLYAATIRPILDKYCIGCHSGSNPPRGINLTMYDHVRNTALDGRLRGVTARLPGYTPMPYGGDKLPDCEIAKIAAWINQGAQQN